MLSLRLKYAQVEVVKKINPKDLYSVKKFFEEDFSSLIIEYSFNKLSKKNQLKWDKLVNILKLEINFVLGQISKDFSLDEINKLEFSLASSIQSKFNNLKEIKSKDIRLIPKENPSKIN